METPAPNIHRGFSEKPPPSTTEPKTSVELKQAQRRLEKTQKGAAELGRKNKALLAETKRLEASLARISRHGQSSPEERAARIAALRVELSKPTQATHAPPPLVLPDPCAGKKSVTLPERNTVRNQIKPYQTLSIPSERDVRNLRGTLTLDIPKLPRTIIKPTIHTDAKIEPNTPRMREKLGRTIESDILATYGVSWDMTKAVRDIYQNFLDGHGGTLEDVKLSVERPAGQKDYKIRLNGQGEYNYELVEKVGGTGKEGDDDTAGGFGEGSVIFSLVLLRDYGAKSITFSSRNWKLTFTLGRTDSGKPVLMKKLEHVPDQRGNSLEIETENPKLVSGVLNGINLAYHPYNPDFKEATVDSNFGGFTYLGMDKRGNLYPVRQRNEYTDSNNDTHWDKGVQFVTLWTHKKVGKKDRDRTTYDQAKLGSQMITPMVKAMRDDELMKSLRALEELWDNEKTFQALKKLYPHNYITEYRMNQSAGRALLEAIINETANRNLATRFDARYLAAPTQNENVSQEVIQNLVDHGYVICPSSFGKIGMRTVSDQWKIRGAHQALSPTTDEVLRINILKRAAQILSEVPVVARANNTRPLIKPADIQKPVYIFNRFAEKDSKGTKGEYANTHVWLDRNYLASGLFEELEADYLHELTHQYGGDESMVFSYKMTDWVAENMATLIRDPIRNQEMQDLLALWESIGKPAPLRAVP